MAALCVLGLADSSDNGGLGGSDMVDPFSDWAAIGQGLISRILMTWEPT